MFYSVKGRSFLLMNTHLFLNPYPNGGRILSGRNLCSLRELAEMFFAQAEFGLCIVCGKTEIKVVPEQHIYTLCGSCGVMYFWDDHEEICYLDPIHDQEKIDAYIASGCRQN